MASPGTQTISDEAIRSVFAAGPLGVLVTRQASRPLLDGLLAAASEVGIGIHVFFTDEAVALLADTAWVDQLPPGSYAACDVSGQRLGVHAHPRVAMAGQYQNAILVRDSARVVTL